MYKIIPHLWFDTQAKEAIDFYIAAFKGDSKITSQVTLHDTPSGDAGTFSFTLLGQPFMAINAGPVFTFNPSISFMVSLESKEEVDALWNTLSEGGEVLMPLDSYPFSEKYGWTQDKYGVSWQISYAEQKPAQAITPTLMFIGEVCGKAEEAVNFYTSVFKDAKIGVVSRYPEGSTPDKPGTIMYEGFALEGQEFAAMDSAQDHAFTFNEAISLMVNCKDQTEIDYYWEKLSAVPEAEQCGWLKDKYGVSWQIVPDAMDRMMSSGDEAAIKRVTEAFLKMKKFDIAELERAFAGE